MNLDFVALLQLKGVDDGSGQSNGESVAPLGYLHREAPYLIGDIQLTICISAMSGRGVGFPILDVHDMFYSIMDRIASSPARLFLAALPDAATATRIFRLVRILKCAHGFSGRLIEAERLHVSLFFLSELSDDIPYLPHGVAGEMHIAPFDVCFDRTVSFRGRTGSRPFVLVGDQGVNRLKSFRQGLGIKLAREGFDSWRIRTSSLMSPFFMTIAALKSTRSASRFPGPSTKSCSFTAATGTRISRSGNFMHDASNDQLPSPPKYFGLAMVQVSPQCCPPPSTVSVSPVMYFPEAAER